ncbi:MAG: hypothetical protein GWO20_03040 [Candidatus Korarchaeota archaeon]|nr:hypothetical protein [Candidatus Korarchaeota archaeon]
MAGTELTQVQSAIQDIWSSLFMDDLYQDNLLINLVNKDYSGDLRDVGDNVRVNRIDKMTGQTLTINKAGGGRTFTPEAVTTTGVQVVADRRFVASADFADLVDVQSMLDPMSARSQEIRSVMVAAISEQINTYLYSLVAPASSVVAATMNATVLAGARKYGAEQFWERSKGWYGLLGPSYWEDMLLDATLTSGDYVDDRPVVGGQKGMRRFGLNLFEDNSAGNADRGLFFHPDFLYYVQQYEPRFKVSDKHAQGEFAYVMSVDLVAGAKLGHSGDVKHTLRTLV